MRAYKFVAEERVEELNHGAINPDGSYVLYWMTATRRVNWNYALDESVRIAAMLNRPVVILEGLGLDYPHASSRHHKFILNGMVDTARSSARAGVTHLSHVEMSPSDGQGLARTLFAQACIVVTDLSAVSTLRRLRAVAEQAPVRAVAVDSVGLLPIRQPQKAFTTAHSFRRHLHKNLRDFLLQPPQEDALVSYREGGLSRSPVLPDLSGYRLLNPDELEELADHVERVPVDASVGVTVDEGGETEARRQWKLFLNERLDAYGDNRNHPDADGSSGLSPWLHYGHISPHEMLRDIGDRYGWSPSQLVSGGRGSRSGWWGLPESVEGFLDEVVTWREVGQGFLWHVPNAAVYDTLPGWAQASLELHSADERPILYSVDELERAETHDPIWNAAQRQLVRSGRMHNYLRMLWGKKVLQWSRHPREAFDTLLYLNDKYALDGRDPNSVAGVGWVFGRFDRAWGPERPIFGKVRYMTSESTARKLKLKRYLERWSE